MMSVETMRSVNPKTVDRSTLVQRDSIRLEPAAAQDDRLRDFIRQIRNPYCYLDGKTVVKISFSKTDTTLEDCLEHYFEFRNSYTKIIEEKQEALLRVKKEMKQSVTTGATERNWVTLFKQYENIEELNRRVLMALVDRILIYEDHAIEIVFKYKDEYQQTLEYVLGYADELAVAG